LLRVDGILERHCLGILDINRLAVGQPAVIGIGNFFGAFFRAQAAGNTFFRIYIARLLDQLDFKIACFTTNILNFAKRQKFDVDVPADLDQFR
jgi:hypothetical protein